MKLSRRGWLGFLGSGVVGGCVSTGGCEIDSPDDAGGWCSRYGGPRNTASAPPDAAPDPASLSTDWTLSLGVIGGVAAVGDTLVVTDRPLNNPARRTVRALASATGEERWRADVSVDPEIDPYVSWPVCSDGAVSVSVSSADPSGQSNVRSYRLSDGGERWSTTLPRTSLATAARGILLGRSEDGVRALDANAGEVCWHYGTGGPLSERSENAVGVPAVAGDTLVTVVETEARHRLAGIALRTGNERWRTDTVSTTFPPYQPVIRGETALLPTGLGVTAYALGDGAVRWRAPRAWDETPVMLALGGRTLLGEGNRLIALDSVTREVRWRSDLSRPTVAGGTVYGVGSSRTDGGYEFALRAHDLASGTTVSEHPLEGPIDSRPIVHRGRVIVQEDVRESDDRRKRLRVLS